MDALLGFIRELPWQQIIWAVGLFAVTFFGSLLMVAVLLVKLPATFFLDSHHHRSRFGQNWHPAVRVCGLVLKNLLGFLLIVTGLLLSMPGIPGQGLLTILIGIMLVNFPGKRRLQRKIVGRPRVLRSINRLRARYNKPPIVLDEPRSSTLQVEQHP